MTRSIVMSGKGSITNLDTAWRPFAWRVRSRLISAALAGVALGAVLMGCQGRAQTDATPTQEVATPVTQSRTSAAHAGVPVPRAVGAHPPALTLRDTPDLLADLEPRVGPQTARRLRDARDAGRAFAQRSGLEGIAAQGVADMFTDLALQVARAERDTAPGTEERAAAIQRAAQAAMSGVRVLIPATAIPEAEGEIGRWTGGVQVTFSHPLPAGQHAEPNAEPPLP
jgi:hypothetical protein